MLQMRLMNNSGIFEGNLILIGAICYVVFAVLEMVFRRFLPLFYFRYGIPVIRRNTPLLAKQIKPGQLEGVDDQVNSLEDKDQIRLQVLNEFEYGLWVSRLKRSSKLYLYDRGLVTRGYIKFDKQTNLLKLRVHLNWFAILFVFMWIGLIMLMVPGILKIVFVTFGVIIIFVFYHREQKQYFKIWHQACEKLGFTNIA